MVVSDLAPRPTTRPGRPGSGARSARLVGPTRSRGRARRHPAVQKRLRTTISDRSGRRWPDLLGRDPGVGEPGRRYVGDITYLPIAEGANLYLASCIDVGSRELVRWPMADHMCVGLVQDAQRPPGASAAGGARQSSTATTGRSTPRGPAPSCVRTSAWSSRWARSDRPLTMSWPRASTPRSNASSSRPAPHGPIRPRPTGPPSCGRTDTTPALGETILTTGTALASTHADVPTITATTLAVAGTVALWAVYFAGSDGLVDDHAAHAPRVRGCTGPGRWCSVGGARGPRPRGFFSRARRPGHPHRGVRAPPIGRSGAGCGRVNEDGPQRSAIDVGRRRPVQSKAVSGRSTSASCLDSGPQWCRCGRTPR